MDLKEILWVGLERTELAKDKNNWRVLVNTEMNKSGFIKCGEFIDIIDDLSVVEE
jgi:hypothetical protein